MIEIDRTNTVPVTQQLTNPPKLTLQMPEAPVNEKFWTIEIEEGVLIVGLQDDSQQTIQTIHIRRNGTKRI